MKFNLLATTVGTVYTAPAYPTATQIITTDEKVATIVGYPGWVKCGGAGWRLNFGGNYKPCKLCNPKVCCKCMGTGWNFKKGIPCGKCVHGKAFVKKHKHPGVGVGVALGAAAAGFAAASILTHEAHHPHPPHHHPHPPHHHPHPLRGMLRGRGRGRGHW